MIRLHQTFGVHTGRVVEFDQEQISIGRRPDSDLPLDPRGDIDASAEHAEIRREEGRYLLVDLDSRNGTLINGSPVQKAELHSGDEIELGEGGPRFVAEIPRDDAHRLKVQHRAQYDAEGESETVGAAERRVTKVDLKEENEREDKHDPTHHSGRLMPARSVRGIIATVAILSLIAAATMVAYQVVKERQSTTQQTVPDQDLALSAATMEGYADSIFLLSASAKDASSELRCSCFAVASDLLASSAECVVAIDEIVAKGGRVFAQNPGTQRKYAVVKLWKHPAYRDIHDLYSANVGLMQVDSGTLKPLSLASAEHLRKLKNGDQLHVFSYAPQQNEDSETQTAADQSVDSDPSTSLSVSPGSQTVLQSHDVSVQSIGAANEQGVHALFYRAPYLGNMASGGPLISAAGVVVGMHVRAKPGRLSVSRGICIEPLQQIIAGLGR